MPISHLSSLISRLRNLRQQLRDALPPQLGRAIDEGHIVPHIGKFDQPQPPKNHPGSKKAFTGPDGLPSESQAEFPIQ